MHTVQIWSMMNVCAQHCVAWPHIRLYISTWTVCTACVRCALYPAWEMTAWARLYMLDCSQYFMKIFNIMAQNFVTYLDKIKLIVCWFKLALVKTLKSIFFGYGVNRKTKSWNTLHGFALSPVIFDQVGFSRKLPHINNSD